MNSEEIKITEEEQQKQFMLMSHTQNLNALPADVPGEMKNRRNSNSFVNLSKEKYIFKRQYSLEKRI